MLPKSLRYLLLFAIAIVALASKNPAKSGCALNGSLLMVRFANSPGLPPEKIPKLYVVVAGGRVVYVGVARQTMSSRLRNGFTATANTGTTDTLTGTSTSAPACTCGGAHEDAGDCLLVETVEAEVVFLARHLSGQWPSGQTEIHFHPSSAAHRKASAAVWRASHREGRNRA